jgi:mRNA interferase RelE/StbE
VATAGWRVVITQTAERMLASIPDARIRAQISRRIDGLAQEPEAQGKPLLGELRGFWSLRAAARYRILFRVQRSRVEVVVVAAGLRKEGASSDVYELAAKLLRLGLLR